MLYSLNIYFCHHTMYIKFVFLGRNTEVSVGMFVQSLSSISELEMVSSADQWFPQGKVNAKK